MKNLLRTCAFVAVISLFFASCKSHEKCPAYGQMNKAKMHKGVRI